MAQRLTSLVFRTAEKSLDIASRSRPHLEKFWSLAKVELDPPRPSQWPEIKRSFSQVLHTAKTGAFLEKPMKEAIPSALVGVEIFCWFIFGEIIGRKSIIGYKV